MSPSEKVTMDLVYISLLECEEKLTKISEHNYNQFGQDVGMFKNKLGKLRVKFDKLMKKQKVTMGDVNA